MHRTLDDVFRFAQEVARQVAPRLMIAGVTAVRGSAYTEILVVGVSCSGHDFRFVIGVARNTSDQLLTQAVSSALRRHLH